MLIRILVLWQLSGGDPGFHHPDVDSKWHYLWAQSIAAGDWLGTDIGVFYRAPLYPYLLGAWITVFGDSLWLIRIVQALAGGLSVFLLFRLGRAAFGRTVGLIGAGIWALWGPAIYYGYELLIPVLIIPLNLWLLERVISHARQGTVAIGPWLITGLILGLSAIARPNILIVIPLLLWWLYRHNRCGEEFGRRVLPLIALVVGAALAILPVTIRNGVIGGDPVLIAYQGGVNLYLGNNPVADGLSMRMPEVVLDENVAWDDFVHVTDSAAVLIAERPLKPSGVSALWTRQTLDYIASNPGRTIGLWAKKAFYFLNGFENGDATNIYRFAERSSILRALIWNAGVYFPLGIVIPFALVGMVRRWRAGPESRLLILFVLFYLPSIVAFLVTARHRLPLAPVLILFAVAAAVDCAAELKRRSTRNRAIVALGAAVVLMIPLNLPTAERIMANPAFEHYQDALAFDRLGQYEEALAAYDRALQLNPDNAAARKNRALDLYHLGRWDESIEAHFRALQDEPEDADLMNNLGLVLRARGDTNLALNYFLKANEANPQSAPPYVNAAQIVENKGDTAAARRGYRRAIDVDKSYGPAYNALGLSLAREGEHDSALAAFADCRKNARDYTPCMANFGAVLLDLGRPKEAVDPLEAYNDARPGDVGGMFNLAVAYSRSGRLRDAQTQLEAILRNYPDHAQARDLLDQIIRASAPSTQRR